VQQAALVLHTLGRLYPLVQIVRDFASRYGYPGAPAEAKLTSVTGQGKVVDWRPKWIEDAPDYEIVRLTSRR
jgi:hypothetical protein